MQVSLLAHALILIIINVYIVFVRSQLDYASLILISSNLSATQNIESVQNRFLSFKFKFKVKHTQHSVYDRIFSYFNFNSLHNRRRRFNYNSLLRLINNFIDCSYLLKRFNFRINIKFVKNLYIYLIRYIPKLYL